MRTHDGLNLHVRVDGPGDAPVTIVLSHGWTEDHDVWRYQVRDLRDRFDHAVRIVTYDMRGHGRSDESSLSGATIANLAQDLGDIIDQFAPRGRLLLAGHSLGGMTLMELSVIRPDLFERTIGVLFVNTSAGQLSEVTLGLPRTGSRLKAQLARGLALRARTLTRKQRLRAPRIESMVARRFLFGDTWRLRDHMLVVESLVNCPPSTMRGFFDDMMKHERHANLSVLEGIPTRVLAGEKDLLTPVSHSRRLATAIPGARLVVTPGCGHMMPLERDAHVTQTLAEMVQPALEAATAAPYATRSALAGAAASP